MPMNLRTGVLIIGSLDWESKAYSDDWPCEQKQHRVNWRKSRLMEDEKSVFLVGAPIRYGRLSRTRARTFTMVISPERIAQPGVAKAVRCQRDITTAGELCSEAEELWKAEADGWPRGLVSASWGCIAVITPPDFLDHAEADARQHLLEDWAARVRREGEHPSDAFGFSEEDRKMIGRDAIVENGRLHIPWPLLLDGRLLPLDLLLVTVTNPGLGPPAVQMAYPGPREIAEAWNQRGHGYYFRCNRQAGIQTADDAEIEKLLI